MGIFDVFKTKVGEAADKAGDVAEKAWDKAGDMTGQAKHKVSDMMDKRRGGTAGHTSTPNPAATTPASTENATVAEASDMVSEGAPVSQTGEAAPGIGDDGAPMRSIKDNAASADDTMDSEAQQAKDRLG